jgi:Flp pilus assembly protein TadD
MSLQEIVRLNQQAFQLYQQGRYEQAIGLAKRACDLSQGSLGEAHPDFATSLNNLAVLYREMGNYAAAEPLCRQALEVCRTALGEAHPDFAESLNNLAALYHAMGNYAAAEPLHRQALEVYRTALGEAHPLFATSLNNLAALYDAMGNYAAAEPLYRQALEVCRTALGEAHPLFATSLNNLAVLYHEMGNYAAAEPLYRQALEVCRTALGEAHPLFATSLNNLAALFIATGRAAEALPLMEQAAAIDDRIIGQVFSIGSESQRAAFLNTVQGNLYRYLSLVLLHLGESPRAVRAALDLVLRRKAIGADALAAQRDAVLGGKYPALEPRLREWAALRMQIAQKTLAGPGPEGAPSHQQLLARWTAQKERLEADLARQIPEMNLEQKLRAADRRAVALGLPADVVLVEFVRFFVRDFQAVPARGEPEWRPARYVAFVLPAGEPDDVQIIDLGEAEPIDQLIADFRAGILGEAEDGAGRDMERRVETNLPHGDRSGTSLREAVFDKLGTALGGRTRLLLAPDGDLTRLPWEVLPASDGRRLIDDYQISYASCGRDVLRFGAASTGQPGEPLMLADPDFDLELDNVPSPPSAQSKLGFWSRLLRRHQAAPPSPKAITALAPAKTAHPAGRRSRDLDRDRGASHFDRLPGTRAEGETIAGLLGVRPWLDAAALEGRLKTACRSPRILHLATHGFFLPDQPHDPGQDRLGPSFEPMRETARLAGPLPENPMLRSGLALAGANTWLKAGKPPEEAEDGLLTAEDVSGLDLLATELVVLSACETGLGQIHVGEGVFGLRRAFVLAGAKTLVMSLWKVPDEPTRELMEDFYCRILAGQGRAEALRQAQLTMKAKYPDPYYWGAFICQGDPSPLGTHRSENAGAGGVSV